MNYPEQMSNSLRRIACPEAYRKVDLLNLGGLTRLPGPDGPGRMAGKEDSVAGAEIKTTISAG